MQFLDVKDEWNNSELFEKWESIRSIRKVVTGAIELERKEKRIGSSLEAKPILFISDDNYVGALKDIDLPEIFITSQAEMRNEKGPENAFTLDEIDDVAAVKKLHDARDAIVSELRKNIGGMGQVIDEVLIAIFSRGHGLLEGVPGLAKTLLVSSIAKTLSLSFKRIQFTPDLMPSDILGGERLTEVEGGVVPVFRQGPVFTQVLLADEVNRANPRTQSALLEAMGLRADEACSDLKEARHFANTWEWQHEGSKAAFCRLMQHFRSEELKQEVKQEVKNIPNLTLF